MTEKIDGTMHPKDTRVHIPSKEEAGYEEGSERAQAREPQMSEFYFSSVHWSRCNNSETRGCISQDWAAGFLDWTASVPFANAVPGVIVFAVPPPDVRKGYAFP